MKLLLDANLSWRLVRLLKSEFPEITHITNKGLNESSSDIAIWEYARRNNYSIVTNDEDFYLLAAFGSGKGFYAGLVGSA